MSLSNALETETLKWQFTAASVTRPTAWYVALHTADPGEAGTTAEVTTGVDADYIRQTVTFGTPTADIALSNIAVAFTVDAASAGYTVTHFSVWSASTAGTYYGSGALPVPVALAASQTITFASGEIAITAD